MITRFTRGFVIKHLAGELGRYTHILNEEKYFLNKGFVLNKPLIKKYKKIYKKYKELLRCAKKSKDKYIWLDAYDNII